MKQAISTEEIENQIILGDCLPILKSLPDKCIDLLLTDPPYGGGAKSKAADSFAATAGGAEEGLVDASTATARRQTISLSRTGGTWAAKYTRSGEGDTDISYWDVAPSAEVFAEMFRVSKNQLIWGGNYFTLPPTRCFNVWKKLTISEKFSMAMAEYCWASFNANAKVWEFAPQDPERFHPTQKPVALFCRQLEEYTKPGDLVLDCFSGSGTTAIACHRTGRRFVCIERDKVYWQKSCERLELERRQMTFGI